jgi:ABC-type transporter Mla subunit MlaD
MPGWMEAFVIVASLAIVLQMAILLAMYLQVRETSRQMTVIVSDLQSKINPILVRVNRILEDSQDRIGSIVSDAAEVTRIARSQAQKVDRVFTDAVDRLRMQVIHADQIVTGALDVIEETSSRVRKTLWGPVHQASALLKGLRVGLDFIRGQRQRPPERTPAHQDEELFI